MDAVYISSGHTFASDGPDTSQCGIYYDELTKTWRESKMVGYFGEDFPRRTLPPSDKSMAWKNEDWLKMYRMLACYRSNIRRDENWQQSSNEINEIEILMKKLEFLFRNEDVEKQ